MSEIDLFKKNQKVMMVRVEDCEFQGAEGPFTVKDVDIFEGRTILKETDMFFGTDGVHDDKNPKNYVFLTPVIKIDTGKKK